MPEIFLPQPFSPLLKWPGNKKRELELPQVRQAFPGVINNYYEPFLGGGACFLAVDFKHAFINDICLDLIEICRKIKGKDTEFLELIRQINHIWLTPTPKIADLQTTVCAAEQKLFALMKKKFTKSTLSEKYMEQKVSAIKDSKASLETVFKRQIYIIIRNLYNQKLEALPRAACFAFLREFCYSGMFRFNSKGEFNIAYSGASYNSKTLDHKLSQWEDPKLLAHLNKTDIECLDFEAFLKKHPPKKDDFVFLDPPYFNFKSYDNNPFEESDQHRLARVLKSLDAKFLMIISDSPLMRSLYKDLQITQFEKKYNLNIKGNNQQDVTHLIIKNY